MIWGWAPGPFHYFLPAEFLQRHTTPVCRRARRLESALAIAAVLVAQYAELPFPIAAQSVRAKQSMPALVVGFDRLFVRHGSPDQPINLLHRLDLRLDDPHLNSL